MGEKKCIKSLSANVTSQHAHMKHHEDGGCFFFSGGSKNHLLTDLFSCVSLQVKKLYKNEHPLEGLCLIDPEPTQAPTM